MAEIVIFHSVLGLRPGVTEAADRLRAAGHTVHTPDLFDGVVYDDYGSAFAGVEAMGDDDVLTARASAAVADLPADLVYAGFSLGGVYAQLLAGTVPGARGLLLLHAAVTPAALGIDSWPGGVPVQVHFGADDPYREPEEIDGLEAAVRESSASYELFDYPISGHLFTDQTLPKEYDAESSELLFERALAFLDRIDRG